MKKRLFVILSILAGIVLLSNCSKMLPKMINPEYGMCGPVDMSQEQGVLFAQGNDQFFGIRTAATGLGPYFVSTGCGECHSSDNRGHPFTILTRFGQADTNGNTFLTKGGPQLQNSCLPGYPAQAIPAGATSSQFIAPITAGVGFLELVPDSEIIALAAANMNNPDGVRGHPNYNTIPSYCTPSPNAMPRGDGKYICKFGRKASTYDLVQQVATAYNHDMGITSSFMPNNPYNYLDQTGPSAAGVPEVDNGTLNSVVFYVRCLQTPQQRNTTDAKVVYGSQVFMNTGCGTCHQPSLTTGYSPVSGLSYQTFSAYTDLLVHDMGPALDDGYTEGTAGTAEWRTAPLWGLGLAPGVQGGSYYLMHDGRAHSIQEAIQLHGGEAAIITQRYNSLSPGDQDALITFLKSL